MTPFNRRVLVLVAGQPKPLSDVPLVVHNVTIAALPTNTGRVCIGNQSVRAQDGEMNALPMMGGDRPDMHTPPFNPVDLSGIWVDAETANEGVVVAGYLP